MESVVLIMNRDVYNYTRTNMKYNILDDSSTYPMPHTCWTPPPVQIATPVHSPDPWYRHTLTCPIFFLTA